MAKSTRAEKELRVNEIYNLIVNGCNRFTILQHGATRWKMKKRQIDSYIAEAHALIAQEAAYHRPGEIGKAKARLDQIFRQAIIAKDYGSAISAQREISKLFSLYEPEPPRVLSIAGVDEVQLKTLAEAIRKMGMKPSDIFESMLQELAQVDRENQ